MILVAGGSGRLGRLVVSGLVRDGFAVRVLTRDPARVRSLADLDVEIVVGDVRNAPTLAPAVRGVATVVSAVQGFEGPGRVSPASVDRDGNRHLVDAAAAEGADVVLMSIVGASAKSPMELFRAKHEAEEHLRASGAQWTIVRATAFVELWAEIMEKPIVFGRGDNPINFVSVNDVAAIVERAVADPTLRGRVIEVGGAQDVTFNELAAMLHERRGTQQQVRHIPRRLLQVMSPFSRRASAAVAMDTVDMTFDSSAKDDPLPGLPRTSLDAALRATVVSR